MASASVEEKSLDLSTCSVCLELNDKELHPPKFFSCAHTYCLHFIKVYLISSLATIEKVHLYTQSVIATGGVYILQGRNQHMLMTCAY